MGPGEMDFVFYRIKIQLGGHGGKRYFVTSEGQLMTQTDKP